MPSSIREDWTGFLREALEAWGGTEGLTGFLLVPSAPQRCTDRLLQKIRELSDEYGCIIQTHVLETKAQRVTGESLDGIRLSAISETSGFWGNGCPWSIAYGSRSRILTRYRKQEPRSFIAPSAT